MQLVDSRMIGASPDRVWAALFDPDVLKDYIPGCQSMTGSLEGGYEAVVVQKVGPVSAKFTGIVTLSDVVPGQAVTISGEGKGGPAGYAKGGARVTLAAEGAGTMLSYEVDASVGGKIAQLGSRIIDGFAKKLADQFFQNFATVVEPAAEEVAVEGEGEAPKKGWFKRLVG